MLEQVACTCSAGQYIYSNWNIVKHNDDKTLDMKDEYWQLMKELLQVLSHCKL